MLSMSDLCSSPSPAKNPTVPPEIPADATKAKRPRSSHAELLERKEAEHALLVSQNTGALTSKQKLSLEKKIAVLLEKIKNLKQKSADLEAKRSKIIEKPVESSGVIVHGQINKPAN